jgi:pimeloyl-ACP methyl ester carboxylesterase
MTRGLLAILLLALQQGKQIPPPGVPIPAADRAELEAGVRQLGAEIEALKPKHADLLADVQIYHKAVDWALRHDEFFNVKEVGAARDLLKVGLERAKQLAEGKPAWATSVGLVPRGYVSKIDGSVQPYGLVVPPTYKPGSDHKHRLDFWLHGRGETLSELSFINGRQKSTGEFAPADTIVLHLYGRFCNASKFAGEVDLFEALDSVKKRYPIDENRLVVRGFSMGGASTWHIAVHHAGLWAAANPGAGFAETPTYAGISQESVKDTPWQATLWHWYNATDYAANLFNCPVVAYSGEKDKQKQAADIMAKAMKDEGLDLIHVIGPNTEHRYEPEAKKEVARRIDEFAAKGSDPNPPKIRFTTWTLRYNQMKWLTVEGLEKHWERATVDADKSDGIVKVTTKNVSALRLGTGWRQAEIDGQTVYGGAPLVRKVDGKWTGAGGGDGLAKRHGLQGPIDDAFLDSFFLVIPTGKPMHEKTGAWVAAEQARAIDMWRRFFRGDARVVRDSAVTPDMIASSNLVFWGDPQSNKLLEGVVEKLPLKWTPKEITVGSQKYASESHVPVLVYPNPLNPKRYVVLNSGFTFQDQAPASNSRHVPMLPDWAVLDVASRKVVAADFFGEKWELMVR